MAEDNKAKKAAPKKAQPAEKTYYIVNPQGTIHSCTREHARERLRQGRGWRMATPEEIQALHAAGGYQRWDRPIAQPWAPEPDAEPEL